MNLGGGNRFDEDGNVIPGKMIDLVVEGENVYIVSVRIRTGNLSFKIFSFCIGGRRRARSFGCVKRDARLSEEHLVHWIDPVASREIFERR